MIESAIYSFILFFTGLFTLIVIFNCIAGPLFKKKSILKHDLKIDILIPARNEEKIIGKCIENVMLQKYKNYNVTVLDDNSEDKTAEIISVLMYKYKNLKLIKGKSLPEGWLGKNWACHQLAQQANGDILIFIDADVFIDDWVIESAAEYMNKYNLSLLSSFPTQVMQSFSVKLVIPLMNWLLLTFLPLRLVYLSPWLSFVAANGQFMCFKRDDYVKIGGHESVASKIVEDMELARLIKKKHMRMMTVLGWKGIRCLMYNSFKDSIDGFTKNFYQGFNTNPFSFIMMLIFFTIIFIVPFVLFPFYLTCLIFLFLIILQRLLLSIICRQNILINTFLHPLQMLIMIYLGLISMIKSKRKKVIWKGRTL